MVAFNLQFHSNIPGRPFGQTTTWSRPATSAGTCGTSPPPLMGDVAGLGFTGSGMPSGCHFYNSELFFYIWTWRSWRVWKLNAAYYPETLVKTADLDPKKNHLVCCHPHGILCFGAVVREYFFSLTDSNLTTHKDAFGARIHVDCRPFFQTYWPGYVPFRLVKHVHQLLNILCFSQGTFLLPLFRECLLQAGGMAPAASCSSLEAVLSKPGGGEAPILMVGGVPEMMMASKPNEIQLHLSQRKGLVKMTVEVGLTLDPCFVFGETETYNQSGPLAQIWNRLTCSVRNCFGIALVFFSGIHNFWLSWILLKPWTFRRRVGSGKSWLSSQEEAVEGCDGQTHGGPKLFM